MLVAWTCLPIPLSVFPPLNSMCCVFVTLVTLVTHLAPCRLLVVVCENKLLLYDLNTRKPYEVSRAVLDGKAPSCVAFLFRGGRFSPGGQPEPSALMTSPVLAVGCADGVVRLLHLATLRVSSGHSRGGGGVGSEVCVVTREVQPGDARGSAASRGEGWGGVGCAFFGGGVGTLGRTVFEGSSAPREAVSIKERRPAAPHVPCRPVHSV
jgi:hypothetical protein